MMVNDSSVLELDTSHDSADSRVALCRVMRYVRNPYGSSSTATRTGLLATGFKYYKRYV